MSEYLDPIKKHGTRELPENIDFIFKLLELFSLLWLCFFPFSFNFDEGRGDGL